MKEITEPDCHAVEKEQRDIADTPERHDTGKDAAEGGLHAVVESELPAEDIERHESEKGTEKGDKVTGGGEHAKELVETGAGLGEEIQEDGQLKKENQQGDSQDDEGIDGSLGDNGAECLGERGLLVTPQDTATGELSDARHDEGGGIGKEDGMNADRDS